jgi:hypothetical protein
MTSLTEEYRIPAPTPRDADLAVALGDSSDMSD